MTTAGWNSGPVMTGRFFSGGGGAGAAAAFLLLGGFDSDAEYLFVDVEGEAEAGPILDFGPMNGLADGGSF